MIFVALLMNFAVDGGGDVDDGGFQVGPVLLMSMMETGIAVGN